MPAEVANVPSVSPICRGIRRLSVLFALAFAGTQLTACGDAATGTSSDASTRTGTVALLFTDLPTRDFDRILVDVSEVRLLADGGEPVTLFEDDTPGDDAGMIDLLDLQTHAEPFAIASGIPAGSYNKIRLYVNSIELLKLDDESTPEVDESESHFAKLPANGKIDLNPRGNILVAPAQTLIVQLDMDANKSLHFHQTGRGEWRFRPVVFVDIAPAGLVRVTGVVTAIDPDVIVCESLDPDALCVTVETGDASLFGPDGMPLAAPLAVDDEGTAIGFIDTGENEGELVLDARVVQIGDTYERFAGTALNAPAAADGEFDFLVGAAQDLAQDTPLTIDLQSTTRIFSRLGEELDSTAIVADEQLDIDGVRDEATDPDTLLATLVVIDTAPATASVSGVVSSAENGGLIVATESGDRCVDAGGSDVYIVANGISTAVDDGSITVNKTVDAYGQAGTEGCLSASVIVSD